MERPNRFMKKSAFTLICVLSLAFSSCKTARVVTTSVTKPISTNKLIRNIEANVFDYKHLSIKKISCQFDNGKTKTSFRANIQADKNKQITVMLTKLNIPVARVWLTPDSVKFINYLDKTYFLDDYSYLSSIIGMDLDFETVHAIISNNIFSLREENSDKEKLGYETKIDSGFYVLQSVKKLKLRKEAKKADGEKRQPRKTRRIVVDTPVGQSIYVDPVTYKLRKIRIDDPANQRKLNISFDDFAAVEKQLYPGEISLQFVSPESRLEMRFKLGGFSMENEKDIRFKVPEKFTRINHDEK